MKRINEKQLYNYICLFLSALITFSVYPFIGLSDGITRWNMAIEVINYGKVVSRNMLSPFISYIQAATYVLTENYAPYTFLQCYFFYLSLGKLFSFLLQGYLIKLKKFQISVWLISSIALLFIPTVSIYPAMLTDSAPIFILLVSIYTIAKSNFNIYLKAIVELLLITLCVGIRINSLVLFGLLLWYYVFLMIKKKEKQFLIYIIVLSLGSICGMKLPTILNSSSYNAATLGMLWEMTIIVDNYQNKDLGDKLSEYGDVDEAVKHSDEPYLNSIVWDNNPPFDAYKIAGEYSNAITKLYIYTAMHYPYEFIYTKISVALKSLGISSPLITSGRGIAKVDNTIIFGSYESNLQNNFRKFFVKVTDNIGIVSLRPYFMILLCIMGCFIIWKVCDSSKKYWEIIGIGIGYYSSFLLNTQAYEYRYYAPSFYLLLICFFCELIEMGFLIMKGRFWIKNKKIIILIASILVVILSIGGIGKRVYRYSQTDLQAAQLNDDNWINGIRKSDTKEILFLNTRYNIKKLKNASTIYCGDEEYKIIEINIYHDYITVYVDHDAIYCGYPQKLNAE